MADHSTVFRFSFYVVFLTLFVVEFQFAIGAHLLEICSGTSGKFSNRGTYKMNLNRVLADLKSSTPKTGFSLSTVGQRPPDQVFGLAQCGAQVSASDCRACILQANTDIFNLCGKSKASMIWYDDCFLRYSDSEFKGSVDTGDGGILANFQKSRNPNSFFPKVTSLLSKLSNQASISTKLSAFGQRNAGKSPPGEENIFGLVDCTRDLSSFDCKFCIDFLISITQNKTITSMGERTGGRIITASCSIRFETFNFLHA